MADFHLAQINIAKAIDSLESETMAGFVARLDEINALADQASGFVWRLQTEDGDATSIKAFDDPALIINMSVWRDIASLKHYVYQTAHLELLKNRNQWFGKIREGHQAMWWIPAGKLPDVFEGKRRLSLIQANGPGPDAFTFSRPYTSDGAAVADA